MPWAIKWSSENKLDGKSEHLIGRFPYSGGSSVSGYSVAVFRTRQQARNHVDKHYSYIRGRKDLQAEPHGWRVPKVVEVSVVVKEAK
jgi:hypothetical protein